MADVKQREGETLKYYLGSFNAMAVDVKGSDESLILMELVAIFDKRTELGH